eukprot:GGOE01037162.1.p1 GENE.GGOE01037162.1~~GGOE01037162.1.p1  ORF type:complete len:542 (-),score=111.36 GGOE01037162.1:178-1803(-)
MSWRCPPPVESPNPHHSAWPHDLTQVPPSHPDFHCPPPEYSPPTEVASLDHHHVDISESSPGWGGDLGWESDAEALCLLQDPPPPYTPREQTVAVVIDVANLHISLSRHLSFSTFHLDQLLDTLFSQIAWLSLQTSAAPVRRGPEPEPALRCVEVCAVDGLPDDVDKGSTALHSIHNRLQQLGYRVLLMPNKKHPDSRTVQGAVDMKIGVEMLRLAGALVGPRPPVDHLLVLSGDGDLQPVVEAVLECQPCIEVWVTGLTKFKRHSNEEHAVTISCDYLQWLRTTPRAHFLPLEMAVEGCAQLVPVPEVIYLQKCNSLSPVEWARHSAWAIESSEKDEVRAQNSRDALLTAQHLAELARELWARGMMAWKLVHLWIDHNAQINDDWIPSLRAVISASPRLRELHLSDTGVSVQGLEALVLEAAERATWLPRHSEHCLYINATYTPAGSYLDNWLDELAAGAPPWRPFTAPSIISCRENGTKVNVRVRAGMAVQRICIKVSPDQRDRRRAQRQRTGPPARRPRLLDAAGPHEAPVAHCIHSL